MKIPAYLFLVFLFVTATGFYFKARTHINFQNDITGVLADTAECQPIFPKAFSPNEDRFNDCFSAINAGCIDSVKCTFYDRWAKIVYETKDPHFCWDGINNKGQETEEGTYYYVYEGKTHRGKKITLTGFIVIVR
jgi:gliding motility-associated-like protein